MGKSKVVIPKDVAEAIEKLRQGASDGEIEGAAVDGVVITGLWDECEAVWKYAKESEDTLLQAVVNGYEIEATPEDRLREYYQGQLSANVLATATEYHVYIGKRSGVRKTLDILGITVEGVNN